MFENLEGILCILCGVGLLILVLISAINGKNKELESSLNLDVLGLDANIRRLEKNIDHKDKFINSMNEQLDDF